MQPDYRNYCSLKLTGQQLILRSSRFLSAYLSFPTLFNIFLHWDVMKKTLMLIDGHSMAFRAFFALPVDNFSTTGGQTTNAVYGFLSMLSNILSEEKPTHVAVAFDVARETFRNEIFPE